MASNPSWKKQERKAAALFGGRRFWSNSGERLDFETEGYVGQVKHVKRLALKELEALALETERLGFQKHPPKIGVVVVKRKRGRCQLVVLTEAAWRELNGIR